MIGIQRVIARQRVAGGVSCSTSSSEVEQTSNSGFVFFITPTGDTAGQSFTLASEITLHSITQNMSSFNDATFTLRIGTSQNLTTYVEEITGTYTGTAQQDVVFTSASNPVLSSGVWYYGIRVVSGTDDNGALRGELTSVYAGGQGHRGDGDTTWDMSDDFPASDLAFNIIKCGT